MRLVLSQVRQLLKSANEQASSLRIVFMGTPLFAADILEDLAPQANIVCVYTQPDKIRSRGKKAEASAVKQVAEKLGLPVRTLSSFANAQDVSALKELQPDVICVAAFGVILPAEVLEIPPLGCINVHASTLPRWRGAAPIERAILAGDTEVGVCVMRMEEGLDTGDFCVARRLHVGDMSTSELLSELALLGAQALLTALSQIQEGSVFWTPQDHDDATYACKIEKGELFLNPERMVCDNVRRVRASSAGHPSKCIIGGRVVTITRASDAHPHSELPSVGNAIFQDKRLVLGCSDGAFVVDSLKPDGKREMSAHEFAAGFPVLKQGVTWGVV